jgi:zinc transport system substrate-binding protein
MQMRAIFAAALIWTPAALFGADQTQVFVTVLPQQTFVERIAGPHARVEALVRAGANPHAYEPTPSQIARLSKADLYFGTGLPVEAAWVRRIRAVNPAMRFVDLSEGITRRQIEVHEHALEHDHESAPEPESEQDPHVWSSPLLVMRMADRIAATLGEQDPEHASDYQERLKGFRAELKRLDAEVRAQLAGLKHRRFMVYHPAWGYFADAYGLTQIPIEAEGKEPGPKRLAALIAQARRDDVRVILAQPQMSAKAAEQVAREIDGRVEVVDALAADYVATIRRLTGVLATADE